MVRIYHLAPKNNCGTLTVSRQFSVPPTFMLNLIIITVIQIFWLWRLESVISKLAQGHMGSVCVTEPGAGSWSSSVERNHAIWLKKKKISDCRIHSWNATYHAGLLGVQWGPTKFQNTPVDTLTARNPDIVVQYHLLYVCKWKPQGINWPAQGHKTT